jgi:DNA-directed RNA polymerase specialized sigma24 family protein
MGETIVSLTPQLRRYAHALLGSWPPAPRRPDETAPRVDQDADDLVHEALLGFWRAGLRRFGDPAPADEALRLGLYRRVTALARRHLMRRAAETLASGGCEDNEAPRLESRVHFAWAPEAHALPLLALDLRAPLALVVLEHLTYAQAGRVLDMPAESALTRLAVARARLATGISGVSRSHLITVPRSDDCAETPHLDGGPVTEGDLHHFVDEQLGETRRGEVVAFLEADPETARRAAEWRRQSERLRRAFEPLMRETLPLSLDFAAPEERLWSEARRAPSRSGVFGRLAALLALPSTPMRSAPQPF